MKLYILKTKNDGFFRFMLFEQTGDNKQSRGSACICEARAGILAPKTVAEPRVSKKQKNDRAFRFMLFEQAGDNKQSRGSACICEARAGILAPKTVA